MNIIEVTHLVKEYKKIRKESGLRGAVKNLFVQKSETVRAVDNISFSIEKLFTFLLPLAWMTFWPVKDMLGLGGFAIPMPLAVVTLVVGLVMFAGSCAVFRAGMGKYESAGS